MRNELLSLHDERIAALLADEDHVDDAARGVDIGADQNSSQASQAEAALL